MTPPPQARAQEVTLDQAAHLLTSFTHFLTVAIHNILFYRNLYPAETFLTARAYNLPVHQSRHPGVCSWIKDAVDAIRAQLVLGTVERIAIVIHGRKNQVLERWMIDVAGFHGFMGVKEVKGSRRDAEDDGAGRPEATDPDQGGKVNWTNVDEALRGALRRMAYAGEKMAKLPEECFFTVAVELREEGQAPIGVSIDVVLVSFFLCVRC
jgi:mitotic spindle assembly checkpoint protein MAD2B